MASPDKTPLERLTELEDWLGEIDDGTEPVAYMVSAKVLMDLRAVVVRLQQDNESLTVDLLKAADVVVGLREALLEAAELLSDVYGDWDAREKYVAVVSPDKPPERRWNQRPKEGDPVG